MTKPTVISLFTGAMGLDLGFEQAGFKICIAVDKDKYAVATIKSNRPEIAVIQEEKILLVQIVGKVKDINSNCLN